MPGPAQTSKKLLDQRGSWRAKDRPDDLTVECKAPDPPKELDDVARAEWFRVVGVLEARGVLSELDRAALTVYCELWSDDRSLGRQVKQIEQGTMDWKRVFAARQDVRRQLKDWVSRLGLSPADRARVKEPAKKPNSKVNDKAKYFNKSASVAGKIGA